MKSIKTPTQTNAPRADWVDLVTGIRAGDEDAVLRLGNIFRGGIRFFLRRALGQHKLESREQEVLALLIKSIREPSSGNPNPLASHVLTVLRQYIDAQSAAFPHSVSENDSRANIDRGAIRDLLAKLAAVDREALRRYYVDQETSRHVKPRGEPNR